MHVLPPCIDLDETLREEELEVALFKMKRGTL